MPRLASDAEAYLYAQQLELFKDPLTVRELSEKLGINYSTAYKRVQRLISMNLVVFSHRNSQHENVYRATSADTMIRIYWGQQGNGAAILMKGDDFMHRMVAAQRSGQRPELAKYIFRFIPATLNYIYDRVKMAKSGEISGDMEDDPVRDQYRMFLSNYIRELDKAKARAQQLLDHAFLYNDNAVRKWGNDFDDKVIAEYEKFVSDMAYEKAKPETA